MARGCRPSTKSKPPAPDVLVFVAFVGPDGCGDSEAHADLVAGVQSLILAGFDPTVYDDDPEDFPVDPAELVLCGDHLQWSCGCWFVVERPRPVN